ncbi:hypothetical protein BC628DRAFT_220249 [Trametes gibbosa]|nr:hypothetical protein BC628DRAFT_220249 [Trametes gibbosa]
MTHKIILSPDSPDSRITGTARPNRHPHGDLLPSPPPPPPPLLRLCLRATPSRSRSRSPLSPAPSSTSYTALRTHPAYPLSHTSSPTATCHRRSLAPRTPDPQVPVSHQPVIRPFQTLSILHRPATALVLPYSSVRHKTPTLSRSSSFHPLSIHSSFAQISSRPAQCPPPVDNPLTPCTSCPCAAMTFAYNPGAPSTLVNAELAL